MLLLNRLELTTHFTPPAQRFIDRNKSLVEQGKGFIQLAEEVNGSKVVLSYFSFEDMHGLDHNSAIIYGYMDSVEVSAKATSKPTERTKLTVVYSCSTKLNGYTGGYFDEGSAIDEEEAPTYGAGEKAANSFNYSSESEVVVAALAIAQKRVIGSDFIRSPDGTKEVLVLRTFDSEQEELGVILMNNRHQVLDIMPLFKGTMTSCSMSHRVIVKAALDVGACAISLYHNHPSGQTEPSMADKSVTNSVAEACKLFDIRVLDHVIVGKTVDSCYSFAENGLI